MCIHLHNAHTPTESDGYPMDYFNSSFDKGPILLDQKTGKPVLDRMASRCSPIHSASRISIIPMSMRGKST